MSSGGGSGPRGTGGTGGGAGGAGGGSSSKGVASSERQGDGSLTVTPDSPADAEWRARKGPLDGVGEITGPWGEEDSTGPQPMDLYGKFTWKIENFSDISKRELRSNVFEVGGMKWYILVYPQGCDVHNHLSLFLCVADYDKLLPGWSHFAQFTIAVVNKDPKKSKYSDTLHRFCKKEHDWGWKKFMELSKVLDGFTVADTLVIKAQVQVIHEKPLRPFRCLEPQYRRELVRVYLTNVEGICRRFLEEKREALLKTKEDAERWKDMRSFLSSEEGVKQACEATEKADLLLKGVVKRFFNEKEVTSTLVMDALYCGCRALDVGDMKHQDASKLTAKPNRAVWLSVSQNKSATCGDLLAALERASSSSPFDLDDEASDGVEFGDAAERDERRLAELGRRTVEMYVLHHLFVTKVEVAFAEAQAIKMQDMLIAEEEEAERVAAELEGAKKSKKAKQKQRKKDKKEAEEAELAAKAAEEAAEQAKLQAIADAKAAEEKRIKDAARKEREAEEAREQEKAAAEAAARLAAELAEKEKIAEEKRVAAAEKAAGRAAAERAAAEKLAAEKAAAAGESSGSGDDAEMLSATGSHSEDDEDSPVRGSGKHGSAPASPNDAKKPLPAPRPLSRTASQASHIAPESPSRESLKGSPLENGVEDLSKRGKKKAAAAAAAEAALSPKKQLPSPRIGESTRGGSVSPGSVGGTGTASLFAGDGALGAIEATALRAHAMNLEAALFEKTNEVNRLRQELADMALTHTIMESGGGASTPPLSPARSGDRLDVDGAQSRGAALGPPPGMSKNPRDEQFGGPPPPPGSPPAGARAPPPLPPGAPPPPPPGPPPPGQTRDEHPPGSFAQAAGGPRPPPGMPPGLGMRTPPGKGVGPYGAHPSPGLEDDFQHLGMIADLLDDSPGGGFF